MAEKGVVSTSMAAELMQKIHPFGYKKYCTYINECESISQAFYNASKWVNYFALDVALTYRNGKVNPNHVYEYFGAFNGLDASAVRKNLLTFISGNIDFVEKRSTVCLSM